MQPKPKASYRINQFNSAVALYDLNTYKKDKYARFFWFSWKFVLFLMSYRNNFRLLRKFNLLKRTYKLSWSRKKNISRYASQKVHTTSKNENRTTKLITNYGFVPLYKSVFLLNVKNRSILANSFLRSGSVRLGSIMYSSDKPYKSIHVRKINTSRSRLPYHVYIHHIRIIDKYRLSLLRTILKRRTFFFKENTLVEHLPYKYKFEYNYMIQYFFNFNSEDYINSVKTLKKNYLIERSDSTGGIWTKLWHAFGVSTRTRFKHSFSTRRLSVTVPAIYYLCVLLFDVESKVAIWSSDQALHAQHACNQFLELAAASVYGFRFGTLEMFTKMARSFYRGRSEYPVSFFFERRITFFLSSVCVLPLSDIEILIKSNCVTIGGTGCPLKKWSFVLNFDYLWVSISKYNLYSLSSVAKYDLNMRFEYNGVYWYLWIFFLKSWNHILRKQKYDFLTLLYKELLKKGSSCVRDLYTLNTRTYTYFCTWLFKGSKIHRNLYFLRFWFLDQYNVYAKNIFQKTTDITSDFLPWSASLIYKRSYFYNNYSTALNDLSFNSILQHAIFGLKQKIRTIREHYILSQWCCLKFFKLKYICSLGTLELKNLSSVYSTHQFLKYIVTKSRDLLGFDYIIKYFLHYGLLKHAIYKSIIRPHFWTSFRSIFTSFNGLFEKSTFLVVLPRYITSFFFNTFKVNNGSYLIWEGSSTQSILNLKILLYNFSPSILDNKLSFLLDSDIARRWNVTGYHSQIWDV